MVAFGRKLALQDLCIVEVERVLDRDRDELGDLAEERDVSRGIRHVLATAQDMTREYTVLAVLETSDVPVAREILATAHGPAEAALRDVEEAP